MTEIKAYELSLEGQFSNELTVREVSVFITKEDANKECEIVVTRMNKQGKAIYKAKLM